MLKIISSTSAEQAASLQALEVGNREKKVCNRAWGKTDDHQGRVNKNVTEVTKGKDGKVFAESREESPSSGEKRETKDCRGS